MSWWRIVLARGVESGASNGLSDQESHVGKAAGTLRPPWPTVTARKESSVGLGGAGKKKNKHMRVEGRGIPCSRSSPGKAYKKTGDCGLK